MRKSIWLLSAALLAVPAQAFAQQPDPGQPTQPTGPSGEAQVDPANTAAQGSVSNNDISQQQVDSSDIVVTATRRNQALSNVPIAVSAVTAENLQNTGATDIRQLNQLSPSLLVSSTSSEGGAAVARIRGIGTVGDNPGLESSVGVFIDGVYRSRVGMGLTELGPIERIEVLRGPQGTLFGRNTSAGLISVITAQPRFDRELSGAISLGNYDLRRAEASVTGPITSSLAGRIDGVYMKRDGFLHDVVSGRDVNDRNRWLVRGQLLFQPSDDISDRVVVDLTQRREECCAATYLPAHDTIASGFGGSVAAPSTIAAIERGLGGIINDRTFRRDVAITPGRDYDSDVDDWGGSNELNYDLGGATLTSITAYRHNKYVRGQDADFNNLDILYRASDGNSFNRFNTFTQELRLNGKAFDNRLDWLVGGYFADESLKVQDNLAYGADYQRFANCLLFASVLPSALNTANPGCVNQGGAGGLATTMGQLAAGIAALTAGINALQAIPTPPGLTPAQQAQLAALIAQRAGLQTSLNTLGVLNANPANPGFGSLAAFLGQPALTLNGSTLNDVWKQNSDNWALFTHNIFALTPTIDVTVGARYTHEKKKLNGTLGDNNTFCTLVAGAGPLSAFQTLPCVSPSAPGGFQINDSKSENRLSGTVVLSWKPTPAVLTYASYSRGYKAGGFNLDRSALRRSNGNGAICTTAAQTGCGGIAASGADLEFKPEINDAFELGLKYNGAGFDVNVAAFHELFRDFQLNTFNGLNFIVENINSCSDDLNGADTDNFAATGACTGKTRAGVRSKGIEVEAFTRPMRFVELNAGVTYADTQYRHNLVGSDGRALTNALFQLPGRRVSNSNLWTFTGSVAWTPPIGGSGLSALVYADARNMSGFNTGSDLDIEKFQQNFTVVNARLGIRGRNNAWSVELWAQNLFDQDFLQVAFDAPIQGSGTRRGVEQGFYTRSTQLFGAFLGEPRTFGITVRGKM